MRIFARRRLSEEGGGERQEMEKEGERRELESEEKDKRVPSLH